MKLKSNSNSHVCHTTQVRAGERTLKELGRLLKFVLGTPGIPSGDVKWSMSWPTCYRCMKLKIIREATCSFLMHPKEGNE